MSLSALKSRAEQLACLPAAVQAEFRSGLTQAQAEELQDDWSFWARPSQMIPDHLSWRIWLVMAGRGFGKTRTGAEFIKDRVRRGFRRLALVGATAADVRDTMVQGESGILNLHWREGERPKYEPSKARVIWPNGAVAKMYSAERPNRLRGPQHEAAWGDEAGSWKYAEALEQLLLGLRLGTNAQLVLTTTPKPIPIIFDLVDKATPIEEAVEAIRARVLLTTGSTFENIGNLAGSWFEDVLDRYQGTRLGEQELYARLLRDVPGALWTSSLIERYRIQDLTKVPRFVRVVVGVDPGGSSGKEAEEKGRETGIVAAGLGVDGHYYVLEDVSGTYTPMGWATAVQNCYVNTKADRVVAEKNFGGEMVEANIRTVNKLTPVKIVNASRGKERRAEPISSLYEQGKVHHVGMFGTLESEMCTWVPALADKQRSPNRMDGLVWALTELSAGRVMGVATVSTSEQEPPRGY